MASASQIGIYCYVCLQACIVIAITFVATSEALKIINNSDESPKFSSVMKAWGKAVWKMRNIYVSILVHIFDFFTDLLVIYEWYIAEDSKEEDVDNVNSQLMAFASIGILIFYRTLSSIAVTITYGRRYGLLQFFDLALFVEIYTKHKELAATLRADKEKEQEKEKENRETPNTETKQPMFVQS